MKAQSEGATEGIAERLSTLRRALVVISVVIGMLGIWITGVTSVDVVVRSVAGAAGLLAALRSVLRARRRGNRVAWFVLAVGVALLRTVSDTVA